MRLLRQIFAPIARFPNRTAVWHRFDQRMDSYPMPVGYCSHRRSIPRHILKKSLDKRFGQVLELKRTCTQFADNLVSVSEGFSMENSTQPMLVRKRDAAEMLAVSERTVDGMLARRELTPIRFGRSVRIDRAELVTLIERASRNSV